MEKNKNIYCGLKPQSWTFVIASLQIWDNFLALCWMVSQWYANANGNQGDEARNETIVISQNGATPPFTNYWPLKPGVEFRLLQLANDDNPKMFPYMTIFYLSGLAWGLVLLGGASRRDPKYLGFWIICNAVLLLLSFVLLTLSLIRGGLSSGEAGFRIFFFCLALVLYGFRMWMVRLFLDDIVRLRERLGPIFSITSVPSL